MMRLISTCCVIAMAVSLGSGCGSSIPDDAPLIARQPRISPDYSDVVIPPNIAPLNFVIEEEGDDFAVRISGESGSSVMVASMDGDIRIPERAWKTLLAQNKGKKLSIVVYVHRQGGWLRLSAIENTVAHDRIDPYVVYRWMRNLHHFHERLYLMQRSLESFEESVVLDNKSIGGECINCHTFFNGRTDMMTYQVRSGDFGLPMMLVKDDEVTPIDTRTSGFSKSPAAFTSWHPSGKLMAFSVNRVSPFEHTVGQTRGEWDNDSDLALYLVASNRVTSTSGISDPMRRETWPAWSADGKKLYFSSAPQLPFNEFRNVRYDLMQIPFDASTMEWGVPEVLVSSDKVKMSCVEPRVSPDDKWVVFCGCEYGNMACFLKSSDLHILNTQTGAHHKLDVNSELSESYPTWSRNGRWISFVSKRRDGLLSHIYFSHFDKSGKAHKPFILPQRDPRYYDSCARTYNRPELAVAPVRITGSALAKDICEPDETIEPPKSFNRANRKDVSQPLPSMEWGRQ